MHNVAIFICLPTTVSDMTRRYEMLPLPLSGFIYSGGNFLLLQIVC